MPSEDGGEPTMIDPGDATGGVRAGRALGLGLAVIIAAQPRGAKADRIILRGGGQVVGKVIPDASKPGTVQVLTMRGKTALSFRKEQVTSVIPEVGVLDEYLARRDDSSAAGAEGQFALGAWAADNKLFELGEMHFQRAVELDPAHAGAHEKLGHVRSGDAWVTRDALREAQGLIKVKGKWVTEEEKARMDADATATTEQASWTRRVKLMRGAILGVDTARRLEAEQQLRAIRDPAAVTPVVRAFSADLPTIRALMDHVLGGIPGTAAAAALVNRILAEADPDVRQTTMEELAHRTEPNVVGLLIRALGSSNTLVVNRAAWALGNLKATEAIPKLIGALRSVDYQVVMPDAGMVQGGGGGVAASFASPGPGTSYGGNTNGIYGGGSIAILNGPVVAPGVVAYGATAAPLLAGPGYSPPLAGPVASFSTGGGVNSGRGPIPQVVPIVQQNVEVRGALVRLTGQDFAYDPDAWRRWVSASFRPDNHPARSVPQP